MELKPSPILDPGDGLPLTIGALSRERSLQHRERNLLSCDDIRLSYGEAENRSRHLARALLALGVTKGTNVGLLFPNGADFLISVLAVTRIGAVVVPFSTLSTADELRWLLVNSDTTHLLAAPNFRSRDFGELLQNAISPLDVTRSQSLPRPELPWLRHIWFRDPLPDAWDACWSLGMHEAAGQNVSEAYLDAVEARVLPSDRAVIIHTSGSTGNPKGVVHCHGSLLRHRNNLNLIRGFGSKDVLYSPAPWFWIAGFSYCILGTMLAGARFVFSNSTKAADVLDVLERERPTLAIGYAQTAAKLAADPSFPTRDLSSLKYGNLYPIMPAGVRPRDPGRRFEPYGMTEAGSSVTSTPHEDDLPEELRGANGPFAPGIEAKIVDPDTACQMPTGELGELWIRGPFMMEGYYGKPRSQVFDIDGWYRTGDIGLINKDGIFFLKGRLSNMIKTSFANVSPREVEHVLTDLTGGRVCIVLGVPDPERGEAVAAVVIAENDSEVDETKLKGEAGVKLSSYKVPRRIIRLSEGELPRLSSGKLDLPKLSELVLDRWH